MGNEVCWATPGKLVSTIERNTSNFNLFYYFYKNKSLKSILFFLLLVFCVSCETVSDMEKATLRDLTRLDGCSWVLEKQDGTRLEPINLSKFQNNVHMENGQKVWVKYTEVGAASICMVGPTVELVEIRNR